MSNYWLSEYTEKPEDPEDEENMDDMEDSEENPDPSVKLTPRQKMLYDHYEMIVEEFGMFDQTAKANGAHYAPAAKNPFVKEGMICANCVFFEGGQGCEIVKGTIEPNAICKLWIIPEELITIRK